MNLLSAPAICASCGTSYLALAANAKYCSNRCRCREERHRRKLREQQAFGTETVDPRIAKEVVSPTIAQLLELALACKIMGKAVKVSGDIPAGWVDTDDVQLVRQYGENFSLLLPAVMDEPPTRKLSQGLTVLRPNLTAVTLSMEEQMVAEQERLEDL